MKREVFLFSPFPISEKRNKEKAFFKMADSSSHSPEKNIFISGSQTFWCEEQYVDTFVFGKTKSSGCLLPSSICKKSGERLLCVCVGGWGNRWSENLRENAWRSKQHLLSVRLVDGNPGRAISFGKATMYIGPQKDGEIIDSNKKESFSVFAFLISSLIAQWQWAKNKKDHYYSLHWLMVHRITMSCSFGIRFAEFDKK